MWKEGTTLRRDPTTGEWVILAPKRSGRPVHSRLATSAREPVRVPDCPLCPGNEHMTPPEIVRHPEGPEWRLRVVPNMFPALQGGSNAMRRVGLMFLEMDGAGRHEVVIESPRHDARLDEMAVEDVAEVVRLWRERYRALEADAAVKAVIVFKNFGAAAGASLSHPHSQILATPVLPPDLAHRLEAAKRYLEETGRGLYTELVEEERSAGDRVIAQRGRFVAFSPFAARFPFETWIAPGFEQPFFGDIHAEEVADFAWLVKQSLRALRGAAGDPDFNLALLSAPGSDGTGQGFVWHLQLLPRLATLGGFELASGMYLNTVAPEFAAERRRQAIAAGSVRTN